MLANALGLLIEKTSHFIDQYTAWQYKGIQVFLVIKAISCSWSFKRSFRGKFPQKPPEALIATWILGLGGSTTVAIMLGQPWSWTQSNAVILAYTIIPMAIYYSPQDCVYLAMEAARTSIEPFMLFNDTLARIVAVTQNGIISCQNVYPKASVLSLTLMGSVASSASGVIGEMMGLRGRGDNDKGHSWSFATPSTLKRPTLQMYQGLLTALAYSLAINYDFSTKTRFLSASTITMLSSPSSVTALLFLINLSVNFACNFDSMLCSFKNLSTPTTTTMTKAKRTRMRSKSRKRLSKRI